MIRRLFLVLLIPLLGSCATPVPPSGGPVDRTPPDLISMDPPSNSVDFDGDSILFEFSERVDRTSFERALTIVPDLPSPPELHWKGRRLEMTFAEPLPDGATFVFTIDNSLRDEHGVALNEPIVRAVATGSTIDSGEITGRVRDPRTGRSVTNIDVVAIRTDTTGQAASAAARYRTQSGPEGVFSLRFLPDASFFVYAFEDRNRNRSVDAGERFAVSPVPWLSPASSDSLTRSFDWWVVSPDTAAPTVMSVRAQSSRRIEMRYSEPVRLDTLEPSGWAVRDTIAGVSTRASGVYLSPSDPRRVILLTDSLSPSTYRVERFATVRDTAGNPAVHVAPPFNVPSLADTVRLQFLRFDPESPDDPIRLTVRKAPGVRFNQFLEPDVFARMVAVSDTAGVPRLFESRSGDGVTWHLHLTPPLNPGETVRVEIDAEATVNDTTRAAHFRRFALDETGALTGYVASEDSVVVEVYLEEGSGIRLETIRRIRGDYRVDDLEVGSYRLRAISDRDGDGAWDWGRIDPYERPESLLWYPDSARVRAGWETVLDTLRFGDYAQD